MFKYKENYAAGYGGGLGRSRLNFQRPSISYISLFEDGVGATLGLTGGGAGAALVAPTAVLLLGGGGGGVVLLVALRLPLEGGVGGTGLAGVLEGTGGGMPALDGGGGGEPFVFLAGGAGG